MANELSVEEMKNRINSLESELFMARMSSNRLNSIFNSMSEGVCLHELVYDAKQKPVDYKIIDVNPVFEKITGIKKEDAIRENETKLKSIFRAAPIGIGLVSKRKLLEVNEKLCEITGYSKEELLNKNSRILYSEDADYEYVGNTDRLKNMAQAPLGRVSNARTAKS